MCFLFCLGGIFRFLIVFWMFVAKYSKYLPQNSKFCRSLWEVIISNHLNWNSNTSPNSKFGCFEIVCVTKCNLDAGQIAKPWRSKDLKPAPNMISEIPQALQLPKRTLQLNVLDSYDTLRLATRFIGAPGGIGCRVMESEEWRGMEKSLLFFCRVWGRCPACGGHESSQIIWCSISSHQEIINEVNLRLTLILVIPKRPKADLSNILQTTSILKTTCSNLSTNLLTDGCCVGTHGRLLLVTVGQGRRSSVGSAIHAGTQCLRTCRVLEVAFCCNQSCHGDLPLDDQHVLTDGCYAVFECFWCTFIDARPLHV